MMGVVIGLMIGLFIAIRPELFRSYRLHVDHERAMGLDTQERSA